MARRRTVLAAAVSLLGLALVLAPSPALASHAQESIFEDEGVIGSSNLPLQAAGLGVLKGLGVNTVRVLVHWSSLAPSPGSSRRPRFDETDPRRYRGWARFDNLARIAPTLGLRLSFDPVGDIPRWAQTAQCHSGSPVIDAVCNPNASDYEQFVQAVGKRYSGSYPDPAQQGARLPKVDAWEIWNEPNQIGWLGPQFKVVGHHLVQTTAATYRRLALHAISALYASGHRRDRILIADTAPLGKSYSTRLDRRNTSPTAFVENLLCLDGHLHRLRGRAAGEQGCQHISRLRVTGYAHHPYQQGAFYGPDHPVGAQDITVEHANRLERLLDAGARVGALPRALPVYYTEYGVASKPPNPIGASLADQALFINQSDYIAYNDPRIAGVSQYALHDPPGPHHIFNLGLRFGDYSPKPAYGAYRLPIYVRRRGGNVVVWGQARPADHSQVQSVVIESDTGSGFQVAATALTQNPDGTSNAESYFTYVLPGGASRYRLTWTAPDGTLLTSREATPGR